MLSRSQHARALPFLIFAVFALMTSVYAGCLDAGDDTGSSEADVYGGYYYGYYRH